MTEESPDLLSNDGYNVAFAYTAEAGRYEGDVTWTTFRSKEAFDAWYTDEIRSRERIVEEGITRERALELVGLTPKACRRAAALQDATMPDGTVNEEMLLMKLVTIELAGAFEEFYRRK
jgi:hypothetical protein